MQKRSRNAQHRYGNHVLTASGSVPAMLRDLGPVVYAVRVGDLIKIGYTSNLYERCRKLGVTYRSLLGWTPASRADEQDIHASLAGHAVRGNEWYPPVDDVLAVVNGMRSQLGIDPIDA